MRQSSEHTSVLQSRGSTSTSQGTVNKALIRWLLVSHRPPAWNFGIEFMTVIIFLVQRTVYFPSQKTILHFRAVSSQFHYTAESISWTIFLLMVLQLIHVLYLVSGTSQIYWRACIIIWLHNFRCWQAICQRLLFLWMWLWLIIVALYCVAATENLLSTLRFAELARDWLHSTGKYAVEGGIISPVHDAYGKKVHEPNCVKTVCYSLMWLHPVLQAAATFWTGISLLLTLCMC